MLQSDIESATTDLKVWSISTLEYCLDIVNRLNADFLTTVGNNR